MERYGYSFGISFAVAVLLTALVFAVKVIFPDFEEWSDETLGHAWLYMGVLALVVFAGLGLASPRWPSGSGGLAALIGVAAVGSAVVMAAAAAAMAALG